MKQNELKYEPGTGGVSGPDGKTGPRSIGQGFRNISTKREGCCAGGGGRTRTELRSPCGTSAHGESGVFGDCHEPNPAVYFTPREANRHKTSTYSQNLAVAYSVAIFTLSS